MDAGWRFLDLDKIDGFYSAAVFESIGKHVGDRKGRRDHP